MDKKKLLLILSSIVLLIILLILFVSCSSSTKSINVVFDSNGGSEVLTQVINEGDLIEEPTAPTRTNFNFIYWELEETKFDFNTKLYEDTTLIAKWEVKDDVIIEEYTITYYLDGGVNHLNNLETITNVSSRFRLNDATKEGYTFEGWYSESTFINKITVLQNVSNNIELYAKWILIENDTLEEYTIIYYLNGGTNDSSNPLKCTKEDIIILKNATRSGYTFEGWYSESTFINKITILQNIENNIELYAKWKETSSSAYTLTLDVNGGEELDETSFILYYGSFFVIPTPEKDGSIFLGWFYGDVQVYDGTWSIENDVTLVAKWFLESDIVEYTIKYTTSGGVNNDDNPTTYTNISEPIVLLPATRVGYDFSGWYSSRMGGTKIEVIDSSTAANVSLYAIWSLATYKITYDLDDGVNSPDNITEFTMETEFTLIDPTKETFAFVGWNVNGTFYETYTIKNTTTDLVIIAVWGYTTCNITYELNEGILNNSNPTVFNLDDKEVELNLPTKIGYEIVVWSLTSDGKNEVTHLNNDLLSKIETTNIVLYAIYYIDYFDYISYEEIDANGVLQTYVNFGSYPKTVVLNTSTIEQLDSITETNENGYYQHNGNEYEKLVTALYTINSLWENTDIIAVTNTKYYFKVEPIKWRVIQNDGTIQVLSENIIDRSLYYLDRQNYYVDGEFKYGNNYEHSTLRAFLNDDFYNKAFSSFEKELIETIKVDNGATTTPTSDPKYLCNDTYDKIYALSYQDALNQDYGFVGKETLVAKVTDYALGRGAYKFNDTGYGYWWLRTPTHSNHYDCYCYSVDLDGKVYYHFVDYTLTANRPAFTFK